MKHPFLPAAALIAVALGSIAGPAGARSDAPVPTRLDVRLQPPVQKDLPVAIVARLTTLDGPGVPGVNVSVYLDTSFFNGRSALLGRAVTDTAGEARVPIVPDRETYTVRARFAGNDTLAPSETVRKITVAPGDIKVAKLPGHTPLLVGVRRTVPRLIAVFVVLAWALLVVGTFLVLRRIRHGGQPSSLSIEAAGR